MTSPEIGIGTRGSRLALAQARLVAQAFEREGRRSRIVVVETEGDRRAPDTVWGEGAFVAAIERALLAGQVDVAVHSAKDIPTEEDPRLRIGAYLPRGDPRDALIVRQDALERTLDDLPAGSRVGTDSPRRTGFLLARRPDLTVHPLHGNVDTRLRRLDAGETDALVLACAGLDRIGLADRIVQRFDPEIVPPAPGQGAIALQIRRDDARVLAMTASIDDRRTRLAVEAERAFLVASGGGCRAPIGALATIAGDELDLLGAHTTPDGSGSAVAHRRGLPSAGEDLAGELAGELAAALASRAGVRAAGPITAPKAGFAPPNRPRVLVTRAVGQSAELIAALRNAGLDPIVVPSIVVDFDAPRGNVDRAAGRLQTYAWVVVTSANGARAILQATEHILTGLATPSWAVIGPATGRVLEGEGIEVSFSPGRSSSVELAADLPVAAGDRVLVVRGDLAGDDLARGLRARGAEVDDVVAYRTVEAPAASRALLRDAVVEQAIDAVVFTSGSTVRGLVTLAGLESLDVVSIPAICIGPEAAASARQAGFRVLAVSASPDAATLARTTARALFAEPQEIT